jgi:N-methylhydantoinase B
MDATLAALAPALGQKALASGSGSTGTAVISGRVRRTNGDHYFTSLELSSGAHGARAFADGINAMRYGPGNPGNAGCIPIEADELANPLLFEKFEIIPDTGGAGQFRGGNGFVRSFRVLTDAQLCICADRDRTAPAGLFGGLPGTTARFVLDEGTESEQILSSKTTYIPLKSGTVVSLQSAGGGGYGNPKDRDQSAVRADLRNGYITESTAFEIYKVNSK